MLYLIRTYSETILDGEGIRYSIYLAGCVHHCPGCHNFESWNPTYGNPLTPERVSEMILEINNNPILDGITFSGGDPFYNPMEFLPLLQQFKKETNQNIWCYTGYRYEEIISDPSRSPLLQYIDTLVDGPFIQGLYSPYLDFCGSSNQRILTLKNGISMQQSDTSSSP